MKVPASNDPASSSISAAQRARETARTDRMKGQKDGHSDTAASSEISGRAKEMALAGKVAGEAPMTREEKIAELRRRIAAGEYNVPPEDVAEKMLKEHRDTHGIG